MIKKRGRPKVQFCPSRHDTFICGRSKWNRRCNKCMRQADSIYSRQNKKK